MQRCHFYRLTAYTKQRGHYQHEYCTDITVYDGDNDASTAVAEAMADCLRDLMRWIYRQLEREYDYQMSNEVVDESIRANEYEFDEDGGRA